MKARQSILGTVIMAFFVIHSATGQTLPPQPGSSSDRKAACELIEASLQRCVQEKDAAEQIADSQTTSKQVLHLCPTNLAVTQVLKEALSKAADVSDKQQAAKLMQDSLREAKETLAFKPLIEAPRPEGFPEPTPVGEIQIKKYPAYRFATTQMGGAEISAFFTLFTHIKKQDVAMTSPVETTYGLPQRFCYNKQLTTAASLAGGKGAWMVVDILHLMCVFVQLWRSGTECLFRKLQQLSASIEQPFIAG